MTNTDQCPVSTVFSEQMYQDFTWTKLFTKENAPDDVIMRMPNAETADKAKMLMKMEREQRNKGIEQKCL